jgi:hypothetical protein
MGLEKRHFAGFGFARFAILACALCVPLSLPAQSGRSTDAALKNACIGATLRAIGMELSSYFRRLEVARNGSGNPATIPALERRMEELKSDLARFATMSAEEYTLAERQPVSFSPTHPYRPGDILEVEGLTRSGPYYHIAGIEGDDFSALRAGERYALTMIPVYRRDYVLPSSVSEYVYILGYGRPDPLPSPASRFSLDPRQLGEEILEGISIGSGTFTARVGSNGCTDKGSFHIDIARTAGGPEGTPHYILTIKRVRPDECKAFLVDGTTLTWDLSADLGLRGPCTFSVANRLRLRPSRQF